MAEPRRIRYGTPCEFRSITHGQLEHFDNKPPPRPLEEPKPAVKAPEINQTAAKAGSGAEEMRQSGGDASDPAVQPATAQPAAKDDVFIPDRCGGWDGTVTEFDARTMYLF